MKLRRLMSVLTLTIAVVVAAAWNSTLPIALIPGLLAAMILIGFGVRNSNHGWTLGGAFFAALSLNFLSWGSTDFGPGWKLLSDGSLLASLLFGAGCVWISFRPFVSTSELRQLAKRILAGGLLAAISAVLLDAHTTSAANHEWLTVVAAAVGILGILHLAHSGLKAASMLKDIGRSTDALMVCAIVTYFSIHLTGMLLGVRLVVVLAFAIFATLSLVGVTSPGAAFIGTRIDNRAPLLQVRLWPIVTAAVAVGSAHAALRLDLADGTIGHTTLLLSFGGVGTMLFAIREFAGPRKPIVLPFSQWDRSLQKLPDTLLNGDIRLIGQPVHRVADAKMVGIQAKPAWSSEQSALFSISSIAADAELSSHLDSVTLRVAQEHLPAVLAVIDADEPWLSVPLNNNVDAANELPERGAVDGLVLRVEDASVGQAIDALRDSGAQLQAARTSAFDCDPEIVTVVDEPSASRSAALKIACVSEFSEIDNNTEISLLVDDTVPPRSLAAILGTVNTYGDIGKLWTRQLRKFDQ